MEKIFEDIKFKYSFRDYQQETLNMLDKYKNDKKIHIVAAPGAGKTILALELLLRIGNKTLILTPTIAIKEQWVERLKKDFENGDKENLISTELENPSSITVITYQALDSLKRKKVDIEKIIKANNIKTIVLDEAHHLRKVWFKTLEDIVDKLDNCTTVSLTATPPYDNGNDFSNYMSLCGDIDAQITVPQLIKSNCLCTHQDYIYFNVPTEQESNEFLKFQKDVREFIKELKENENFIKAVALNNFIINPENNVGEILEEFDFYIAILSFLNDVGYNFPKNYFNKNIKVPKINKELIEIILQKYIFGKGIEEQDVFSETFKNIKQKLNSLGCIDEKTINLKYSKELSEILLKNTNKLDSINEIIKIEYENLKEKLKLVVVTDFIKDEFYDIEEEQINEIGVMPIFRKILSNNSLVKMIVLTGTNIIIPTEFKEKLLEIAEKEYGITKEIVVSELGIDFNYSKVSIEEKYKRYSVNLITKLFHETDCSVLIGTIALIGEGWDAPFINSLILASFVSSYVTSNQVRGRAIRIDKLDLNKVSNIWHLVCLENEKDKYVLGNDYELLTRRFSAYEGIDIEGTHIDSGIERFNIENRSYTKEEIEKLNNIMKIKSGNREEVAVSWKQALKEYIPECKEKIPIEKIYKNRSGRQIKKGKTMLAISEIGLDAGLLVTAGMTANPEMLAIIGINRYIFNKLINSEKIFIKNICKATYFAMIENKLIDKNVKYYVKEKEKSIIFGLRGADTHEQMLFIKCVKQAMTLNYNSRYIINRGRFTYSVPEIFSKNKKEAEKFHKYFKFGKLIYTRSEEGKKILLKNKMKQFN